MWQKNHVTGWVASLFFCKFSHNITVDTHYLLVVLPIRVHSCLCEFGFFKNISFSGIGSYVQRIKIEEGWKWWNYQEQMPGDHRWHKFNWDIYKDPLPKNYTTSTGE